MPTENIHIVQSQREKTLQEQIDYLTNELAKTQKTLNYLLNDGGIDFDNINEIRVRKGTKWYLINEEGIVANNGSTNTFNFDLDTGNLSITGIITALAGMIGGWTIQNNALYSSTTTYPRVVIDPSNNEVTFYASATKYIRIGSLNFHHGGSEPFIDIWDGSDYVSISLNDFYLVFEGSREARFTFPLMRLSNIVSVNFGNFIDEITGDSIWDIESGLQNQINNKADHFNGYNGPVVVGDGFGGTKTLYFTNGVLTTVV
jgi:hypothetical protein